MQPSEEPKTRTRAMLHQGVSYELPPGVQWMPKAHSFLAVWRDQNKNRKTKTFTVGRFTFEEAFKRACEVAKTHAQAERRKEARYPVQGVDANGRPLPLGTGIYMQFSRNSYQLISVNHGSKTKGTAKRHLIALGPKGQVSPEFFNAMVEKARELRARWVAQEEKNFRKELTASTRKSA